MKQPTRWELTKLFVNGESKEYEALNFFLPRPPIHDLQVATVQGPGILSISSQCNLATIGMPAKMLMVRIKQSQSMVLVYQLLFSQQKPD
jgi:hypothetical protein